jgi:hypothetical protein
MFSHRYKCLIHLDYCAVVQAGVIEFLKKNT